MSRYAAIRSAISLMSVPTQLRAMRAAPLPEGTLLLLGVAANDEAAVNDALQATGRPRETVVAAAAFFIEQVLLRPDSDSYRVLGAAPDAPAGELRTHMALLMKWLHPDVHGSEQRVLYVSQVTRAWEDLKTPERRQFYDTERTQTPPPPKPIRRRRFGMRPDPDLATPHRLVGALSRLFSRERS